MRALIIHVLADYLLIIILMIGLVLGLSFLRDSYKHKTMLFDVSYAAMAGLTALLIGKLLSLAYQPAAARPFLEQGVAAGASYINNPGFPSDHALLGGVVVFAIIGLTKFKKTGYILGVLLVLMCIGRVLALVHTPLDIIGGLVAASVGALWYVARRKELNS